MKNRIFSSVLVLAIVAACACMFGCGGNSQEKDPPKAASFTVRFETNGGSPIDPITVERGATLKKILDVKTTVLIGKKFDGWYSDSSLAASYAVPLDTYIDKNMTLYAAWRDYTDAELLQTAVENTYAQAVAAHDKGFVRLNISSGGYGSPDVMLALDHGVVTAGARNSDGKYYKDGFFYYTSQGENIKLKQKAENTAPEFLYLRTVGTVDYKAHGFYSLFAPMSVFRFAETSYFTLSRDGDIFTATCTGGYSMLTHNWNEQGNPTVYFDAGKIFRFTVRDDRVVKAEQAQSAQANRTIEFFFEGDDIPEIAAPADAEYTQKWQVTNSNGRLLILTELDKEYLDETIYGKDCLQITRGQTYYYDEAMTDAVKFVDGVAPLDAHIKLYHADVNFDDLVIDGYKITSNYLTLEGTAQDGDIKTMSFVRKDGGTSGYVQIKIAMSPYSATDKEFTVELMDRQEGEEIRITNYTGSKTVDVPASIAREYTIKITAVKGGYTEYIVVKPYTEV